ncbi:FAD-dependent oxidoreductase [Dactylosporangium siamense]|uniref:Monooxygenase n=1 Tax=Dactylosporangium siamense TaxID=685454 RepID=A0A919U608_9ACTN|nr:NAD(P)/FAD-dependent oxidoreductase [Dactylosporangium siamense]GIG42942.1 monooxygenase [Dactylosporangium siamense]
MRVIVIGGGTGGMCLAHGLRRAGIDVQVFERHRTRTDGLHGYRVGIDPDGSRALKACLPPEVYDLFRRTCAAPPETFAFLDERLRHTLTVPLRPPADDVNDEKSVSRMTLRQVLYTGIEVRFGREFTHYEQHDGAVTAHFADGSTATGDLLVGADGTNSRVRAQLLPHARVEDSGVVAIGGKVALTERTRALLPEGVFPGIGLILAPHGLACILHVMEFPWGPDGASPVPDDPTRDHVNWGISAHRDRFPAGVTGFDGPRLIEQTLAMTPRWDPGLRRLFADTDPASCFPIAIRTSVPVPAWPSGNVTLLGDAIHTMTPGQGVGANTALRDARNLLRALTSGDGPLPGRIEGYERRMRDYGFAAVAASKARTGGDQLVHRPVIGRLALAGQRAFLRATDRVPALKRKFEASLYTTRGGDRED